MLNVHTDLEFYHPRFVRINCKKRLEVSVEICVCVYVCVHLCVCVCVRARIYVCMCARLCIMCMQTTDTYIIRFKLISEELTKIWVQ